MASVTVTNVTDTTATIELSNLNTYWFQKRFTFYWGEISYSNSDIVTSAIPEGGTYSYTYTGLSPNTSYIFGVYIEAMQSGTYYYEEQVNGNFTTSGGGGGSSTTYTVSTSGNNVIIDLYNTDPYYDVYFYLYDSPSSSTSIRDSGLVMDTATYQFSGLSNGTYYVEVKYQKYGTSTWTFLQNRNTGYTRSPITVGGSPVTTGGYVYIFTGSEWKKAKPYIFDGSQWKPASPYIFNGSQWKPAIE